MAMTYRSFCAGKMNILTDRRGKAIDDRLTNVIKKVFERSLQTCAELYTQKQLRNVLNVEERLHTYLIKLKHTYNIYLTE